MIILESERLLFRNHKRGDLEIYCAIEADPELRRYVGGFLGLAKTQNASFVMRI